MCVAVMAAGVQSQRHTNVPLHLSRLQYSGHLARSLRTSAFRPCYVLRTMWYLRGIIHNAIWCRRALPCSCGWAATTYVTRALGPIATAAVLPRSSAAPLPPITLLYMTASHLAWTARQLAATAANAGSRRNAMSADADASFRRHVSICFPEGLLNAESMSPAEIAAAMLPHYEIWLRQARSAIGYPPTSQ